MASSSRRQKWVTEKCNIANALASGEAGGGYSEAAILVCAVLNALAAEVWPGRGLDRVRFIELLVRLSSSPDLSKTISTPILVQHLEAISMHESAKQLKNKFLAFSPTRVITGLEVDNMEDDLVFICSVLRSKDVRKFSYACLLYEEVRSSYAHEYKPGYKVDPLPVVIDEKQSVSYVNRLLIVEDTPQVSRLIHFHINWLTNLAIDLASKIDALSTKLPFQEPNNWWIDGAP